MAGTAVSQRRSVQQHQGHSNRKRRNNWEARNGKSRRQARSTPLAAKVASKPLCSVCNQVEEPKYKCPKCRDSYCSIQCCRDHKAKGCSEIKGLKEEGPATSLYLPKEELLSDSSKLVHKDNKNARPENDVEDDELEDGWKITDAMEEAIKKSVWLKKELKDAGLRQIIGTITTAPRVTMRNRIQTQQEEELDQAKTDYPQFKQFLDKLLVTAGVLERQGTDARMDLDEWLTKEQGPLSEVLTLKPIMSKVAAEKPIESTSHINEEGSSSESSSDEGESSSDSSTSEDSNSTSSDEES